METLTPKYRIHAGRRYRLGFRNASDDVVMVGGFQEVEFDFVADNPGPALFHYRQQLHMDFGFMALFAYA